MKFANPEYLYLLLILIPMTAWYVYRQMKKGSVVVQMSDIQFLRDFPKSYKIYFRHVPFVCRLLAISMLIVALARPQKSNSIRNENIEGIDIVMSIDISSSMLAEDLKPNRLEASKDVATEFIMNRPNDNIGLVVFSSESFTQCPMTIDHTAVVNLLQNLESGIIEDGTAIGLGIVNAVNRIKDSQAVSKVIILLTDGSNNCGDIAPITAAEIAKTFGIRIYTIGLGTKGMAPYPIQTSFGVRYQNVPVDIDEPTLQQIAEITGGSYFRATDNKKLKAIYEEIDQMEKSKISVSEYSKKSEEFALFALLACLFLIIEIFLKHTLLRSIP